MTGRVVHFEVPAKDVNRAKKFYADVFGWQITQYPGMDYFMAGTTDSDQNGIPKAPGAINGGMLKRGKPVDNPVITLQVDDIDTALREVESHGGKTHGKKQAVGDMGWSAYFKDSEGNVMGLWQSSRRM